MPVARALQTSRESVYVFFYFFFRWFRSLHVCIIFGCICRQRQRQQRVHVCVCVFEQWISVAKRHSHSYEKCVCARANGKECRTRCHASRFVPVFFLPIFFLFRIVTSRRPTRMYRNATAVVAAAATNESSIARHRHNYNVLHVDNGQLSMVCDVSTTDKTDDSKPLAYVHAKFALRQMSVCVCAFLHSVGVRVNLMRRTNADAIRATVRWPLAMLMPSMKSNMHINTHSIPCSQSHSHNVYCRLSISTTLQNLNE